MGSVAARILGAAETGIAGVAKSRHRLGEREIWGPALLRAECAVVGVDGYPRRAPGKSHLILRFWAPLCLLGGYVSGVRVLRVSPSDRLQ